MVVSCRTRGSRCALGGERWCGSRACDSDWFRTSCREFPDVRREALRDPRQAEGGAMLPTEVFVPVDNSPHSDWAVERALEICRASSGRITGNHVYAARLHDVRFRQLETGLPARFQTPDEIKRQRRIHDKLIEKGLQLIADSFLDALAKRCEAANVPLVRQLLEGINYEEIAREVNRGEGALPGLIGFDADHAARYDGSANGVRGDVKLDESTGRIVAENEDEAARL